MRHKISDFLVIAAGQFFTAVAMLVGMRLLTELLSPDEYGVFILWVGIVALFLGFIIGPYLQGVLRYFVQAQGKGKLSEFLFEVQIYANKTAVTGGVLVVFVVLGYQIVLLENPLPGALLFAIATAGILVGDVIRNTWYTLLNGMGKNTRLSFWSATDSMLRALFAGALAYWVVPSAVWALIGYACASLLVAWAMKKKERGYLVGKRERISNSQWHSSIREYAIPLIPTAFIGWANGVADRYLLAGLGSVADAGIYAAMYAIASQPFIMISRISELAMRQSLYAAIERREFLIVKNILIVWLSSVLIMAVLSWVFFTSSHELVAYWLLGENFRNHSNLIVWISAGYVLFVVLEVIKRVIYAAERTSWVLNMEMIGVVSMFIVAAFFIYLWGIDGAARAVPVYFFIQLMVASYYASRVRVLFVKT